MSIMDIIQQKKREFFLARDHDKQQLQRTQLEADHKRLIVERQEAESIRKLQGEIREERGKLFAAKTEGTRRIANKVGGGFSNFAQGLNKIAKNTSNAGAKMRKNIGTNQQNSPIFSLGNSPFNTGGVTGSPKEPTTKKASAKVITINIQK